MFVVIFQLVTLLSVRAWVRSPLSCFWAVSLQWVKRVKESLALWWILLSVWLFHLESQVQWSFFSFRDWISSIMWKAEPKLIKNELFFWKFYYYPGYTWFIYFLFLQRYRTMNCSGQLLGLYLQFFNLSFNWAMKNVYSRCFSMLAYCFCNSDEIGEK